MSQNAPPTPSAAAVDAAAHSFPALASWKRRGAALFVDLFILGVAAQIIAWPFSSALYTLGAYGRLIGLASAVLYFGLFGSSLGGGQTIGKRMLGIAVRSELGMPIGAARALARAFLLVAPWIANGFTLPRLNNNRVIAAKG